jgi:hypothetical protein
MDASETVAEVAAATPEGVPEATGKKSDGGNSLDESFGDGYYDAHGEFEDDAAGDPYTNRGRTDEMRCVLAAYGFVPG